MVQGNYIKQLTKHEQEIDFIDELNIDPLALEPSDEKDATNISSIEIVDEMEYESSENVDTSLPLELLKAPTHFDDIGIQNFRELEENSIEFSTEQFHLVT